MTVSPPRAQVVSPPRAHFQVDNFAVMSSMKRCAMMTLERMAPPARLSSSIQISPVRPYCNVTVRQHPSIKTGRFISADFHLFTALLTISRPCNTSVSNCCFLSVTVVVLVCGVRISQNTSAVSWSSTLSLSASHVPASNSTFRRDRAKRPAPHHVELYSAAPL